MSSDSERSFLFHPASVSCFSLLGALFYALWITFRFSGDKLTGMFVYVVPIIVPFVAFLFDRAERFQRIGVLQLAIDAAVVVTAMWRVIGDVPYVSGHALFLSYAVLSTRRGSVGQVTAGLVVMEVLYLKYVVWQDWVTPTVGLTLGGVAALVGARSKERMRAKDGEENLTRA